jgi:transcriptional regulator with XRE-family HTH domain
LRYTLGDVGDGRHAVPVPVREKLKAVAKDLGSQARVARALGVSPSRVSRWLKTEEPDPENQRKVEGLEFVLAYLLSFLHPETAVSWLNGHNRSLNGFRPIDYLARGRIIDVIQAARGERAGSFA